MFTNVRNITPRFNNIDNLKWSVRQQLLQHVTDELIEYILADDIEKHVREREDTTIKKLRYYQQEAVDILLHDTSTAKQCIMACGTGKTVIMFEYLKMNGLRNKKILFMFPSLQLISQVYKRFIDYVGKTNILCICSQMDKASLTCGEATNDSEDERIYNEFLQWTRTIYIQQIQRS